MIKAKVLHGQWVLKAISPSDFPWKLFVMDRISQTQSGRGSGQGPGNLFDYKPVVVDADARLVWTAMWKGWMKVQKLARSEPPVDRATAATVKILGQSAVWSAEWTHKLRNLRRMDRLREASYTTLGDLWSWPQERWPSSSEIKHLTGVNKAGGDMLITAIQGGLKPELQQTMLIPTQREEGSWYAEGIQAHLLDWSTPPGDENGADVRDPRILAVSSKNQDRVTARVYRQKEASLDLVYDTTTTESVSSQWVPMTVLIQKPKNRWEISQAGDPELRDFTGRIVWWEGQATARLDIVPQRWSWPHAQSGRTNRTSLLMFSTNALYKALVRKQKQEDRPPMAPSWELPMRAQKGIFKHMWNTVGVAPKLSSFSWLITQKALPNADRHSQILALFEPDRCVKCAGNPRHTSQHILVECRIARRVWTHVLAWIRRVENKPALQMCTEAALFGGSSGR